MSLTDRLLDFVAKWFSPSMDHPARGGLTGEAEPPEDDADDETES